MGAEIDEVRLLADPTRARIVDLVLGADGARQTVTRLADQLGLRQPTVSHHVKVLTEAGLLDRRPQGREVWYSVSTARVDRVADLLAPVPDRRLVADGLDRVIDDLTTRFAGSFSRETVERYVRETADLVAEQGVERNATSRTAAFAAERLRALATSERPAGRPEVLFVCVRNAGRSQLAAAMLAQLAGDRVGVRTAGSAPAADVGTTVVSALDEIGVPLGAEFPKPLTDEIVLAADVVVTMGCGDACPVYPGRTYLDWPVDDPAGRPLSAVRGIRDDIDVRVRQLLSTLV